MEQCATEQDLKKKDMTLTPPVLDERTGMPYHGITYYNEDNKIVKLARWWEKQKSTKEYFEWKDKARCFNSEKDAEDIASKILNSKPNEDALLVMGFYLTKPIFTLRGQPKKYIYYKNKNGVPKRLIFDLILDTENTI